MAKITAAAYAKVHGVDPATVRKWIAKGLLDATLVSVGPVEYYEIDEATEPPPVTHGWPRGISRIGKTLSLAEASELMGGLRSVRQARAMREAEKANRHAGKGAKKRAEAEARAAAIPVQPFVRRKAGT